MSKHILSIDLQSVPADLRFAVSEIMAERNELSAEPAGIRLRMTSAADGQKSGYQLIVDGGFAELTFHSVTGALRGLGSALGCVAGGRDEVEIEEEADFSMVGVMFDLSRNGVLHLDGFKAFIRRLALMGVNTIFLYCEDTYEIPGEPFFGYLRGRYTHDELKELDVYAGAFGVELIPCIQTLGHLEQIIKWPAYSALADTKSVLLAEDPSTYALIEKMIDAASSPFKTDRIHVGMDEAWGIGSGRYKEINGEKSAFEILNNHLKVVRGICQQRGLKPIIWSDMYFRIGSPTGGYYDKETVISDAVIAEIPDNVELVYWDYYHSDPEFYKDWIGRHRLLGSEPLVALGVWTWNVHWAALPFSSTMTAAGMQACRSGGIKEVFTTLWGDDGMECDLRSALPGIQEFAEYAYHDRIDPDAMALRFLGATGNHYKDWVAAAAIDILPGAKPLPTRPSNVSKWLLWNDPGLPHLRPEVDFCDPVAHYATIAQSIRALTQSNRDHLSLDRIAQLADVLAVKVDLRNRMADAYRQGNREELQSIAATVIPDLLQAIEQLWKLHRSVWHRDFKTFGWETIEGRYGALLLRTRTLGDRLQQYLDSTISSLPELEVDLLKLNPNDDRLPYLSTSSAKSPSYIQS